MSNPKLSILIPSLQSRKGMLDHLLSILYSQNPNNDTVEVVVLPDEGQMSIGQKRQMLLAQSNGEYVVFVDDDDMVPPDYIPRILKALEKNPDCTSLNGEIVFSDGYARPFIHSLKHPKWVDDHENKVYYRPPNHLNAVKRSLALQVGFPAWNSGEDRYFSINLLPLLKTEEPIEGTLYYYMCRKTFEETHNNQVKR